MGYDMVCVDDAPQEEQAAVKAAHEAFYAACRDRDALERGSAQWEAAQLEVLRLSAAMNTADRHSFRLNVWGMQIARRIMDAAGMLKDGEPSSEDYPRLDLLGVPEDLLGALEEAVDDDGRDLRDGDYWQRYYGAAVELTDAMMDVGRAYRRALREHLTAHDRDTPGIAVHKLDSNDGWYVTPFEIKYALRAWDKLGREAQCALIAADLDQPDTPEDHFIWRWIAYLRLAETRGGFRVH